MEKSIAEQVVDFAYSLSDDGFYRRPRDSELRDFGGRLISSSNDGESVVWEFPDGSRAEIGCSIAEKIMLRYDLYTISGKRVRVTGETQDEVILLARRLWDALAHLNQWRSARP